jgi:hypothetical protein
MKTIHKCEFMQHCDKYLKWVEEHGAPLVIAQQNKPSFVITKIKPKTSRKPKTFLDLRGFAEIKVLGDINERVLPEYLF